MHVITWDLSVSEIHHVCQILVVLMSFSVDPHVQPGLIDSSYQCTPFVLRRRTEAKQYVKSTEFLVKSVSILH